MKLELITTFLDKNISEDPQAEYFKNSILFILRNPDPSKLIISADGLAMF